MKINMNWKQALFLGVLIPVVLTGYAYFLFYDTDIPFWKAYLISIGALLLAIGIMKLMFGIVRLYERLGD